MSFITRGFSGRSRERDDRLPPGQTLVHDFPVLSAGPTPDVDTADWEFTIRTESGEHRWNWDEFMALDIEDVSTDIHCVTHWSKLATTWRGVSVDTLLEGVETEAEYVSAWCDDGYRTNLPLEDVTAGQAWIAYEFGGEPLDPEHGGPARLLVPHLYFWKSAKWVRGLELLVEDRRGLAGRRQPRLRRPVAGAAL